MEKEKEKTLTVKFCVDTKSMTSEQRMKFSQYAGGSRAVYNWCVSEWRAYTDRKEQFVNSLISQHIESDDKDLMSEFRSEQKKWKSLKENKGKKSIIDGFYDQYKTIEKEPNSVSLSKKMKDVGFTDPEHPLYWNRPLKRSPKGVATRGIPSGISDKTFRSFDTSVQKYYAHIKNKGFSLRKNGTPVGSPQYKSRYSEQSFGFANLPSWSKSPKNHHVTGNHRIALPLIGSLRVHNSTVRLARLLSRGGVAKSAHFTQAGNRWYVAITVSMPVSKIKVYKNTSKKVFSGDVGVNKLITSARGEMIENRKIHLKTADKIAELQRKMAKKSSEKVSVVLDNGVTVKMYADPSYAKLRLEVARLRHKESLMREHYIHTITKRLTVKYGTLIFEDLRIGNMMKKPKPKEDPENEGKYLKNGASAKSGLARSVSDASWGKLFEQLSYKSDKFGAEFVKVNPAYTSRTCYECGHVNKGTLAKYEVYVCESCGYECDRDINAAKNILNLGLDRSVPSL